MSADDIKERLAEIDVFGGERRDTLDQFNPGIYKWKTATEGSSEHFSTQHEDPSRTQQAQFEQLDQRNEEEQSIQRQPQILLQGEEQQVQQRKQQREQTQKQQQQMQPQQQQQEQRVVPPKAPPRQRKSVGDQQNTTGQVSCLNVHT